MRSPSLGREARLYLRLAHRLARRRPLAAATRLHDSHRDEQQGKNQDSHGRLLQQQDAYLTAVRDDNS